MYFAKALWFPFKYGGVAGSIVLVSTPASNRADTIAWASNGQGIPITSPEWFYYEVWFHSKLAVGNVAGLTQTQYQGTQICEEFHVFLDSLLPSVWRQKYSFIVQIERDEIYMCICRAFGIRFHVVVDLAAAAKASESLGVSLNQR